MQMQIVHLKGNTKKMQRIRRLSVALTVAGLLGVAVPAAASALSTITISGATASYPLVSLLANKYVKLHPHKVKFKIAQGGAQVGVNDVAAGRVTIGDVSRDPIFGSAKPLSPFGRRARRSTTHTPAAPVFPLSLA